jgi:hypothetical protein
MFRPDDYENNRTAMYDRPGPQIDGQGNVEQEKQIEIPLVADDFVANTAYIRRDHRTRDDEHFKPKNHTELSNSIVCLIDDYKDDSLGLETISDIYTAVKSILKKV